MAELQQEQTETKETKSSKEPKETKETKTTKNMAKQTFPVSDALRETVISHPNIQEVHFTEKGLHYFNVYEHKKTLYGRIHVDKVVDKKSATVIEVKTPVESTKIVGTMSREEVTGSSDN